MDQYIQPHTFYLIVLLITLLLTLGAGFLLGSLARGNRPAKVITKSGQSTNQNALLNERKSFLPFR